MKTNKNINNTLSLNMMNTKENNILTNNLNLIKHSQEELRNS